MQTIHEHEPAAVGDVAEFTVTDLSDDGDESTSSWSETGYEDEGLLWTIGRYVGHVFGFLATKVMQAIGALYSHIIRFQTVSFRCSFFDITR